MVRPEFTDILYPIVYLPCLFTIVFENVDLKI